MTRETEKRAIALDETMAVKELLGKQKFTLEDMQEMSQSKVFDITHETIDIIYEKNDSKLSKLHEAFTAMARCVMEKIQDDPEFSDCYHKTYNAAIFSMLQELCRACLNDHQRQYQFESAFKKYGEILNRLNQVKLCTNAELAKKLNCSPQSSFNKLSGLKKDGVVTALKIPGKKEVYYSFSVEFDNFYRDKEADRKNRLLEQNRELEFKVKFAPRRRGKDKYFSPSDLLSNKETYNFYKNAKIAMLKKGRSYETGTIN